MVLGKLMRVLETITRYRKTYKNWMLVVICMFYGRHIIKISLKNGGSYVVSRDIVILISLVYQHNNNDFSEIISFDKDDGVLSFLYDSRKILLKVYAQGHFNGEFSAYYGAYAFLEPLQNKKIIDIGANIADTSIWFQIKGAIKVIALEPYKFSYTMAKESIKLNRLSNTISLINAGYGEDGTVELENIISDPTTQLTGVKNGELVPVYSLRTIIQEFATPSDSGLLLKMDCEGCEYHILREDCDVLRKFEKILIEYHYGYENIVQKLEKCGFMVSFSTPRRGRSYSRQRLVQGYIYAVKKTYVV